jgi:hypothetical protein
MDSVNTTSVVHFYDTRLQETLCGLRGFSHRSTKYARGVTCQACVGLLHERLTPAPVDAGAAAGGGTAG